MLEFKKYRNSENLENQKPKFQSIENFTREIAILKYIRKIVRYSSDFPDGGCQSTGMFQDAS